ncbi:sensor histidine kinase [Microcella humidisoli]|uniref:Histidine kinase n=1 Tax=Microcella humidisoli TaxID=2963406 RepID=A0ABY5FXN4_9MICO|nr:ATP-binding protein [Microcella humidisoli]UTT63044.1 histidine kinase [Microcella humidisoli]
MSRPEALAAAPASSKPQRSPLSRKRVDTVISRSVAWFGIVFGLQAIPGLLGQYALGQPIWSALAVAAIYGSLLVALICSTIKRWVGGAHLLVSGVYLVALLTWPFFLADPSVPQQGDHWLYQLTTVATATAAIGLRVRGALIYLIVVPLIYGIIRATPQGGGGPWELGLFNAIYAIILGGAVLIIVTMTRSAATSVDEAQGAALDRYARAVRQHATEVERVHVDSIVHDSVLTTLLTAARAESSEQKALAAQMASNAMRHLREAALVSPDDGTTVRFRQLADRIVTAARQMQAPFTVRVRSLDTRVIPSAQAEALYSAAVQAMMNSVQHAGPPEVRRWLKVSGVHGGAVEIEIGDAGAGFDPAHLPEGRLGVRRSIVERTANAGGHADVRSSPGKGTVVVLSWPVFTPDDEAEAFAREEAGA